MKIIPSTQVKNWVEKFKTLGKSTFDLKHVVEVEYLKKLNEIIGR